MHGAEWQGDVLFCIYDHYRGDEALATLRVGGGAVLANVEWGGGGGRYAHRVWGFLCSCEQAGGAPQYKGWGGVGGRWGGQGRGLIKGHQHVHANANAACLCRMCTG